MVIMFVGIAIFDSKLFDNLATVTFSALILTEFLNIYSEVKFY